MVVFGGSLLLYLWLMRFMAGEHGLIGMVLFLLAVLSLGKLMAILWVWYRPFQRPR